jgi:predicted transcriptional regulator
VRRRFAAKAADRREQPNFLQSGRGFVKLRTVTDRNEPSRPLTALQQAIVDFLWSGGPASAEQVREALLPERPLTDSSVRTLLRRLEAQGHLRHRVRGQTYLYEAVASSRTLAARAVREMIERFWAGSAEQFVLGMVDDKVLSAEQLERLTRKVKKRR